MTPVTSLPDDIIKKYENIRNNLMKIYVIFYLLNEKQDAQNCD